MNGFYSLFSKAVMPFVKNLRYGFATNSSSSHSLVYLVDPSSVVDDMPDGNQFSWNMFHAFTTEAKKAYLLAGGGGWDSPDGYVDHQSQGTLPSAMANDVHVGVIGGNDNDGSTLEELHNLHVSGVVNLDMMLAHKMIDEYEYKAVKEGNFSW